MRADEPHPQIQGVLDDLAAAGVPPYHTLSVQGARARDEDRRPAPEQTVAEITDLSIDGPGGPLDIRFYVPDADPPLPVVVYFHGGGWVIGDIAMGDRTGQAIAKETDCLVASVDYRHAPEHQFPAAVRDAYAATRWICEHAGCVRGDPERVAVAGQSSGGNLATAVTLLSRDRSDALGLVRQVLVYPVTEYAFDTSSYEENADGYFLTAADMRWFWDLYLEAPLDGYHPYASPLKACSLRGLPPTTIVTCGFDPLRDEGVAYADRLQEAGVEVNHSHFEDMVHGFFGMLEHPRIDAAHEALEIVASDLSDSFRA